MSVRSAFHPRAVFQSATPADRTSRRSSSVVRARRGACGVRACVQAWRNALRVAIVRARACVRACMRAWRNALRGSEEKTAGQKEGGNPEQEKGACARARSREGRGRWERRVSSCVRKRRRVRAAVLRGPRAAGAARVPLRAQQHRSCVIILRTSRLWVRTRAAALVLAAVREDVRASYRWRRAGSRAGQAEACAERTPPICAS